MCWSHYCFYSAWSSSLVSYSAVCKDIIMQMMQGMEGCNRNKFIDIAAYIHVITGPLKILMKLVLNNN